jgi:MOSC domain
VTARLGVDIGGTFTDLVVIDETSGAHERRLAALVRAIAPRMAVPAPSARTSPSRGWTGRVGPGWHVLLGETVLLRVTRYTSPCTNITRAFKDGDDARASQKRPLGWRRVYALVLATGSIRQGDPVHLLDEAQAAELTATAR